MPHCVLWHPSDWCFAVDSLIVAARFHLTGEMKFATELRNREKTMGTTTEYRRALRIRYMEPEAARSGGGKVIDMVSKYSEL